MEGVEPGQRILDWLELGSPESWDLNLRWLDSKWPGRCMVLCGASPDRSLYDHLNSYTGERGSDGVVRLASANLNYSMLRLRQAEGQLLPTEFRRSRGVPFALLPGSSHGSILDLATSEQAVLAATMIVFKVIDTAGHPVEDFDLLLTAGHAYSPDALPSGFFLDRQRNSRSRNMLTYFVDHAALSALPQLGFTIRPRPEVGPVSYASAEFRSTMWLRAHETMMIEITLDRRVENRVFKLSDCA
jgi:hypothetical protein